MTGNRRPKTPTAAPRAALDRAAEARMRERLGLLWRDRSPSRRGRRAVLSAERIAAVAIGIADVEGLGGVAMARVAERLGCTPMALYRHVPNKAEMIELMFDTAMGSPPKLGRTADGWRPKIERWARALWMLTMAHPWALDVLNTLRLPGPNELAWMEAGTAALAETGLSSAETLDALFVIVGQVRMNAQYAVAGVGSREGMSPQEWAAGVAALLREHGRDFPVLASAVARGAFTRAADPLAFGLQCALDGIERLAPAQRDDV